MSQERTMHILWREGREGVSCKCFDHSPPKRLVFLPAPHPEQRKEKAISAFVTEKRKFGGDRPISENEGKKERGKGEKVDENIPQERYILSIANLS